MKKAIIILLTALLALSVFVACNQDTIVDDMFNGGSEPVGPVAPKVTITFKANGGTGDDETQVITSGVATALTTNSFTAPTGNVFAGWTTDDAGEKAYYGDGDSVTLTEDLTLYAQWGSPLYSDATTWADGLTYTLVNDVSISSDRINVNGNVKLFIPNGKTLTASKGITVTGDNSLTINGGTGQNAGILVATGSFNRAGIGGDNNQAGGKITINGGIVNATGGQYGAGIGGGNGGAGGTVTIAGGTVTATGGQHGAGIGGANGGAGGTVTINGGKVTADGSLYGAGIGGGKGGAGGTVTIAGGTVTATGGQYSAGIGGGGSATNAGGVGANVTISGGSVTATGGGSSAVGIGGGYGSGLGDNNALTLTGITMEVSTDNTSWTDYNGTRKQYMRTKTN